MFTYHAYRYGVPLQEDYTSLRELLERAWADMEYGNAYPTNISVNGHTILPMAKLAAISFHRAPDIPNDPGWDAYFDSAAQLCYTYAALYLGEESTKVAPG